MQAAFALFSFYIIRLQGLQHRQHAQRKAYPVGDGFLTQWLAVFNLQHAIHDAVFATNGQADLAGGAAVVFAVQFANV